MAHTIITIGRQFGSGGGRVAVAVGKKLGIPVYDNELISQAAEQSGFSKELFTRSDEKRSLFTLSGFFAPWRMGQGGGGGENFIGDDAMFKIQSDVIRDIAARGPAILIGRCSDYILRDVKGVLNVFITAPMEYRIRQICEREGLDAEQAAALIRRKDKTRSTYYNYYTLGSWGEASGYDLCIDSSILGIEGTADLIIAFAKAAGEVRP